MTPSRNARRGAREGQAGVAGVGRGGAVGACVAVAAAVLGAVVSRMFTEDVFVPARCARPEARAVFGGAACDGWAFICGPPRVAVRLARSSEHPPDMAPFRRRHFSGAVDDAPACAAEGSFFWLVGQAVYLDVCDCLRMKHRVATSPRCERAAGQSIAPEKCQWRRADGRSGAGRRHTTLGDAAAFDSKLRLRPAYCVATAPRPARAMLGPLIGVPRAWLHDAQAWLRRVRERPRLSRPPPRLTPKIRVPKNLSQSHLDYV